VGLLLGRSRWGLGLGEDRRAPIVVAGLVHASSACADSAGIHAATGLSGLIEPPARLVYSRRARLANRAGVSPGNHLLIAQRAVEKLPFDIVVLLFVDQD
jgi:hypothetical protein